MRDALPWNQRLEEKMKKRRLIEYCERHDIMVPSGATVDYLKKAIVRHHLNGKKIEGRCFGFYSYDNSTCEYFCDYSEKCFATSIGMEKEKYFKKLEKLENPKIKF